MKIGYLKAGLSLASVVLLLVALGTASAADKWILLGEKVIKSTDPSTEIKGEEGKTFKEDVKRAKLSVEGADVEITNVVFHWKGGKNEAVSNVGVVKAGGETAAKDAPTRESTLLSVSVQYKILNNKPSATVKVWGYD
jgi:hypothetical protein